MKGLLLAFSRWETYGQENVPLRGPLIVTANHLNLADPPLLSACIPRRIAFMAKQELWRNPLAGLIVASFGAFPVARGQQDRQALRKGLDVLKAGLALGMFPEGTRSRSGHLGPCHPGTALLALHSQAPILPVAITGTQAVEGLQVIVRRPRITVTIGVPYHLPDRKGRIERAAVAAATDLIMSKIAELLPEEYRPAPAVWMGDKTTNTLSS
ncbi:MAG: 1-acyl-sn-glycerol-3-phosphate acyltransferase [Chloroflexota bacterium]|nr:MAG: 1-acyl-sn-glycerol-3-phosphate acyltransferase [Chloroflexota bacterium]